jgi:ribosomal subunit interface protein
MVDMSNIHPSAEVSPMSASLQVPLQTTFRNMPRSDALDAHIRERAAKLEEFHPRITSCRVTVEEIARHQHQGREFRVRVDVRVPGHQELVVNRDHAEDPYVALRDAFDAMARQLDESIAEDVRAKRAGTGKYPA